MTGVLARVVPLVLLGVLGLAPVAARAGGASGPKGTDGTVTITIDRGLRFSPAAVTITPGTRVHWVNKSVLRHTVTADPKKAARAKDVALPDGAQPFDSGYIDPKGGYDHGFTVPGHYRYFCIPHEGTGMVADITVKK